MSYCVFNSEHLGGMPMCHFMSAEPEDKWPSSSHKYPTIKCILKSLNIVLFLRKCTN